MPNAEFTVQNADGHTQTMTDEGLLDDMRTAGLDPKGFSSDGLNVKFQDANGEFEAPIDSLMGDKGWAVTGFKPTNADYSTVSPGLRAALGQLPDDLMKEAYLKGTYKGATIKGAGDDWYMHNPETNQWLALTNKPGLDMSDAASAGLEGLRMVGSVGGALLGSGAGPVGTIAGAGVGGALSKKLINMGLSAYDPAYADVQNHRGGSEELMDLATTGGLDAAAAALPFGVGKMLPKGMATGALEKLVSGPLSSAAQVGGKVLKSAGGVADYLGGLLGKESVANVASNFLPGVGDAVSAGYIPRAIERGMTWGGEKLGQAGLGENIFKLRNTTKPIGDKITEALVGKGELFGPRRLAPSDILGNLSEEFAAKFGGDTAKAGARGESTGRFLSNVADLARSGENVATRGVQSAAKGVQGVGKLTRGVGQGLDTLGSSTRAIEYPAAARMASEELLEPYLNSRKTYRHKMSDFQRSTMGDSI